MFENKAPPTIATLDDYSIAEIIAYVGVSLLKQGKRSVMLSGYDRCMYRGPNGTKCAVGMLIPDELYYKEIESAAARALPRILGVKMRSDKIDLLEDLQSIHDERGAEYWRIELLRLASGRDCHEEVEKYFAQEGV